MKEKENECNGEKQLNLELYMGCCKCVLRLQQLPLEWNSMLLVLLEMESRILSVFSIPVSWSVPCNHCHV